MNTNVDISRKTNRLKRLIKYSQNEVEPSYLLLTYSQWWLAAVIGLALSLSLLPYYVHVSPWIGVSLFFLGITIVHFRYACKYIIPFPHMMFGMAILQYVLAAWISRAYPPVDQIFDIGSDLPHYLKYGTGVIISCAIGLGLGLIGLKTGARISFDPNPQLLRCLDCLILVGFFGFALTRFHISGLGFVFVLIGNLRYVGLFGHMLYRSSGWVWRFALIFTTEILSATNETMFHGVILWALWGGAFLMFRYKPSWTVVFGCIVFLLVIILPIQESKWQLRQNVANYNDASSSTKSSMRAFSNFALWSQFLLDDISKTLGGQLDKNFVGDVAARYNQGWIVNKVMQHVPAIEQYAHGETLKNAAIGALVPRLFYPNKAISGGRFNMEKYAGIVLQEDVSMNLGYAGEMYANFGFWGGILGCGFFCLTFGLIFKEISVRAFISPLWWVVLPYIGTGAINAEDDIVGTINWTFKACLCMFAVCYIFPIFRRSLFSSNRIGSTFVSNQEKFRSGFASDTE